MDGRERAQAEVLADLLDRGRVALARDVTVEEVQDLLLPARQVHGLTLCCERVGEDQAKVNADGAREAGRRPRCGGRRRLRSGGRRGVEPAAASGACRARGLPADARGPCRAARAIGCAGDRPMPGTRRSRHSRCHSRAVPEAVRDRGCPAVRRLRRILGLARPRLGLARARLGFADAHVRSRGPAARRPAPRRARARAASCSGGRHPAALELHVAARAVRVVRRHPRAVERDSAERGVGLGVLRVERQHALPGARATASRGRARRPSARARPSRRRRSGRARRRAPGRPRGRAALDDLLDAGHRERHAARPGLDHDRAIGVRSTTTPLTRPPPRSRTSSQGATLAASAAARQQSESPAEMPHGRLREFSMIVRPPVLQCKDYSCGRDPEVLCREPSPAGPLSPRKRHLGTSRRGQRRGMDLPGRADENRPVSADASATTLGTLLGASRDRAHGAPRGRRGRGGRAEPLAGPAGRVADRGDRPRGARPGARSGLPRPTASVAAGLARPPAVAPAAGLPLAGVRALSGPPLAALALAGVALVVAGAQLRRSARRCSCRWCSPCS